MAKAYDLPLPDFRASSDPPGIERGWHLEHTIGGCYGSDCHGSNFAGGETMALGPVGKIIDRKGGFVIDVARRIDHSVRETPPSPEPTARNGAYLARGCTGGHGEGLSGGKIPGAPPDLPIPANITPDATDIASWSHDGFRYLLATRERPDGRRVAATMPTESLEQMNDVEKQALRAYLCSVEPRPFGQR